MRKIVGWISGFFLLASLTFLIGAAVMAPIETEIIGDNFDYAVAMLFVTCWFVLSLLVKINMITGSSWNIPYVAQGAVLLFWFQAVLHMIGPYQGRVFLKVPPAVGSLLFLTVVGWSFVDLIESFRGK